MRVRGSRVGVIGGSIAGCAAAIALDRLGCDVQVLERSTVELSDRGHGILVPIPLRDELIEAGYLARGYASCPVSERWWIIEDGTPAGRRLWTQPSQAAMNNWGGLWRSLRGQVASGTYRRAAQLVDFDARPDGVTVELADGSREEFDALVGADGYRSTLRARLHPETSPSYAGYVIWRGAYPESRLHDRAAIERADRGLAWYTVGFEGGHAVNYMIPGSDDRAGAGHRRVNWLVYSSPPAGMDATNPETIVPGQLEPETYAHLDRILSRHVPSQLEPFYRASPREEVVLQPVYDEVAPAYATGRVLLIGDAGAVTRPHTGSGATKALQDALALERLGHLHDTWEELLPAYDAERVEAGRGIVELGRRIGAAQVEDTPDWASMAPEDFDAWTRAMLSGKGLYMYGNVDAEESSPRSSSN